MWPRGVEVRDVLPQHASQVPLAQGVDVLEALASPTPEEALAGGVRPRGPDGVRSTAIPLPDATRANAEPYLPSLSRLRKRGALPQGVASRSCCATQASVGWRVTPA